MNINVPHNGWDKSEKSKFATYNKVGYEEPSISY